MKSDLLAGSYCVAGEKFKDNLVSWGCSDVILINIQNRNMHNGSHKIVSRTMLEGPGCKSSAEHSSPKGPGPFNELLTMITTSTTANVIGGTVSKTSAPVAAVTTTALIAVSVLLIAQSSRGVTRIVTSILVQFKSASYISKIINSYGNAH